MFIPVSEKNHDINICIYYSGRNFALLEFCEMRDLEPKILRNSRNSQSIENT